MVQCHVCGKDFKWPYLLIKHMNRKFPCTSENVIFQSDKKYENLCESSQKLNHMDPLLKKKSDFLNHMDPVSQKKSDFENIVNHMDPVLKCKYCHRIFSTKSSVKRHEELRCNLKDDIIRDYEIQLNKVVNLDASCKTCRFCNKMFTSHKHLSRHTKGCKEKELYKLQLKSELDLKTVNKQTTSYITNNVNVTHVNNYTINNNFMTVQNDDGTLLQLVGYSRFLEAIIRDNSEFSREKLEYAAKQLDETGDTTEFFKYFSRNDNAPQLQFLQITNHKAPHLKVIDKGKVVEKLKPEVYKKLSSDVLTTYMLKAPACKIQFNPNEKESMQSFYLANKEPSETFEKFEEAIKNGLIIK